MDIGHWKIPFSASASATSKNVANFLTELGNNKKESRSSLNYNFHLIIYLKI